MTSELDPLEELLMGAHALNRHFEWKPRRGPFRLVTPEQADDYNRDGFVVLRGVFDPDTLSAVIAEIDPEEAKVEAFLRTRQFPILLGGQAPD